MVSHTIAAISTAMSSAGIGIVRISGDEAFSVINRIFHSADKKKISGNDSHTIHYGHICDGDEIIDEVLVMVMKGPRSFTAEDTIEINCHGGMLVVKRVLETVIKYGAVPAEPGEFTKRAFLNGRIDLSQAEAVIDLINSRNDYARKSSVSQLKGDLSVKIKKLRQDILYQIAFIESALDDPEHISLEGFDEQLDVLVSNMMTELKKMIDSADNGRMISEGIRTVILGKPNAGKSSVLNRLLGEERAIVTDIAGTTRDTLEENIMLEGISLTVIDTAGIRKTEDIVEKIGVKKALDSIDNADLILYVVDGSSDFDESDWDIIEMIRRKQTIVLLNKSDLNTVLSAEEVQHATGKDTVIFSAKDGNGLEELTAVIKNMFFSGELDFNDELYITNVRHKTALIEAYQSIDQVKKSIEDDMPEDFFTIDLMNAYEKLGTVIGEAVEDDLVNEIFGKFCMGK